MGVKLVHTHDAHGRAKECFVTQSATWKLSKQAVVTMPNGSRFTVAFMGYTGSWYAYDIDTGKELARFDRAFYEAHVKPWATELIADPDCRVAS